MTNATQQQAHRPSVDEEFARTDLAHWKQVVSQCDNPVIARTIVQYLDAHPPLKAANAGVYLAASVTVEKSQITYAKAYRAGHVVAVVVRSILTVGKVVLRLTCSVASLVIKPLMKVQRATPGDSACSAASEPATPATNGDPMAIPQIVDPFDAGQRLH